MPDAIAIEWIGRSTEPETNGRAVSALPRMRFRVRQEQIELCSIDLTNHPSDDSSSQAIARR